MSGTQKISTDTPVRVVPFPLHAVGRPVRPVTPAGGGCALRTPGMMLRRLLLGTLVLATGAVGVWMMYGILSANELTALRAVILVLFGATFLWICVSFWTAVAGVVLQLLRLDPLSLRRLPRGAPVRGPVSARTAVIMPAYNEETSRLFAGLEACWRSLQHTGAGPAFDFHLLSDTTDVGLAREEEVHWQRLIARLGRPSNLFYRRRRDNVGRKVGNIEEFCKRRGREYDYMIVLDADSVMTGECMLELVSRMQANPDVGLMQTVPMPVRQRTFFGRCLQFAAHLYGPMLATGAGFWQGDSANYWGHNAIVRVQPFMRHCRLPVLPGRPPFGGEILSHDFVEAALLRRAGWRVVLATDIGGSYEELPGNMLDYAARDRRWAQGNLQHLRLLTMRGLHGVSRLHFLMGATAYLSSLFWLLLLALGTFDAVVHALSEPRFFSSEAQLFPEWPVVRIDLIKALLVLTLVMLLGPKLLGVGLALLRRRHEFGGGGALLPGAAVEVLFTALLAPITMMFNSLFVLSVLAGREVRWNPQSREGRVLSWREVSRATFPLMIAGMLWSALVHHHAPLLFWWLSPVLLGLMLAPWLVGYSSSLVLGERTRAVRLLQAPCEREPRCGALATVARRLDAVRTQGAPSSEPPRRRAAAMQV